jgi:hypothetical protein
VFSSAQILHPAIRQAPHASSLCQEAKARAQYNIACPWAHSLPLSLNIPRTFLVTCCLISSLSINVRKAHDGATACLYSSILPSCCMFSAYRGSFSAGSSISPLSCVFYGHVDALSSCSDGTYCIVVLPPGRRVVLSSS